MERANVYRNWSRGRALKNEHFRVSTFSFPQTALPLLSTKNRDLWAGPSPEVRDSRTSRQNWQIGLAENTKRILYASYENRVRPELSIPAAGQKDRGLWAREWCFYGVSLPELLSHYQPLKFIMKFSLFLFLVFVAIYGSPDAIMFIGGDTISCYFSQLNFLRFLLV